MGNSLAFEEKFGGLHSYNFGYSPSVLISWSYVLTVNSIHVSSASWSVHLQKSISGPFSFTNFTYQYIIAFPLIQYVIDIKPECRGFFPNSSSLYYYFIFLFQLPFKTIVAMTTGFIPLCLNGMQYKWMNVGDRSIWLFWFRLRYCNGHHVK